MRSDSPSAAASLQVSRVSSALHNARIRALVYQALLVTAVAFAVWYLASNTAHNLQERRIASGFGFLAREAGFEISETTLLVYSAADTYLRALMVGVLNTFRVALIGIVLATILGTLLGLARLSRNWLLAKLSAGYVEIIRNIPLLVQLFFWYAVITENLPGPGDALSPAYGIFISNRGVAFPTPLPNPIYPWLRIAFIAGIACAWMVGRWARRQQTLIGRTFPTFSTGAAIIVGLPLVLFLAAGAPVELQRPVLTGFNFTGGGALSPEFAALLIGLVIYTASFVAEIVRAGVLAVDRGQFEAAHSLGLKRGEIMRLVVLPQALRLIIPPMTSQYLNLTKNSSLAVAIGYPELVSVANTTINQTGQAIEGIAIIMAVYLTISLSISALMNWYNRRIELRGGKG